MNSKTLYVCFGQYVWCGNSTDKKEGTGYFLSDQAASETNMPSYMLYIDIPLQHGFTYVSCGSVSNRIYYIP